MGRWVVSRGCPLLYAFPCKNRVSCLAYRSGLPTPRLRCVLRTRPSNSNCASRCNAWGLRTSHDACAPPALSSFSRWASVCTLSSRSMYRLKNLEFFVCYPLRALSARPLVTPGRSGLRCARRNCSPGWACGACSPLEILYSKAALCSITIGPRWAIFVKYPLRKFRRIFSKPKNKRQKSDEK